MAMAMVCTRAITEKRCFCNTEHGEKKRNTYHRGHRMTRDAETMVMNDALEFPPTIF
jgi:hypothetical protein